MAEDEVERRLVEELRRSHEESLAASREISHPSHSMLPEEYMTLKEKAELANAKYREAEIALREYRKNKR